MRFLCVAALLAVLVAGALAESSPQTISSDINKRITLLCNGTDEIEIGSSKFFTPTTALDAHGKPCQPDDKTQAAKARCNTKQLCTFVAAVYHTGYHCQMAPRKFEISYTCVEQATAMKPATVPPRAGLVSDLLD